MSNEMTINFNGENYLAQYNKQTGYYEIDLSAPTVGGIYKANVEFTDLLGQSYENEKAIQVLAKQKLKTKSNKIFMWIFDCRDFTVKDIVEIADYEINIDEETNAKSIIKILKKTTAKADDIVVIKKDNKKIYWGAIDEIQNENGKQLYEYTLKYITNMFDENVFLNKNVEENEIEEGYYRIKFAKDSKMVLDVAVGSLENGANIQIFENNNTDAQKWKISKNADNTYTIECIKSKKVLDIAHGDYSNGANVQQYTNAYAENQKWKIVKEESAYYRIHSNNFYLTVEGGQTSNYTNIKINEKLTDSEENIQKQRFILEKIDDVIIKEEGIEDYIAKTIEDNFINSKDTFLNKNYLEVRVKTHTKLQTSVSNVQENTYNFHTFITNCTQLYNINFNFFIENKKLVIEIENKSLKKELIDVKAQAISNYTEVFETSIVSKVEVATDTQTYCLYLLNDRTTTTDAANENRAKGKTKRIYTAKFEDANQKALDCIQSNRYNHNITFDMLNKYMQIGTPIAIKTKESVILDTYISALKITQKNFIEYTCGNIRIKFIDKLLKERRK